MLGRDQYGVDGDRSAVLVGDGDLSLTVGTQVRDQTAATHLRKSHGETVGQPNGHRHEVVVVVAGVAEHHSLVAGAQCIELIFSARTRTVLVADVDASGDVGTLLAERHQHGTRRAIETLGPVVVANVENRLTRHRRDIHHGRGRDLAGHHAQTSGQEGLTGDASVGVLRQDGVEDTVRDLVSDLVGVAFGHRL